MPLQHRIGRPRFLANPIQYVRWASVAHTGAFWAVVIGGGAFPMCFAMLYARRLAGWDDAPRIPTSWPSKSFYLLEEERGNGIEAGHWGTGIWMGLGGADG